MIEAEEGMREQEERINELLDAAKEPEPVVEEDEVACPECGHGIGHVVRRDGEGPRRCPNCDTDLEPHIEE